MDTTFEEQVIRVYTQASVRLALAFERGHFIRQSLALQQVPVCFSSTLPRIYLVAVSTLSVNSLVWRSIYWRTRSHWRWHCILQVAIPLTQLCNTHTWLHRVVAVNFLHIAYCVFCIIVLWAHCQNWHSLFGLFVWVLFGWPSRRGNWSVHEYTWQVYYTCALCLVRQPIDSRWHPISSQCVHCRALINLKHSTKRATL